jgi:hypothetical protein
MFKEGNQIHNFMFSSGSGTVINYGSGSGSDFFTSSGSGSGSSNCSTITCFLGMTSTLPTTTCCLPEAKSSPKLTFRSAFFSFSLKILITRAEYPFFLFPSTYAFLKDVQATGEAFSPQKEHPAIQKIKFINLFLIFGVIFGLLHPDPQHC